jgi:tRNA modification GTPase
MHSLDDTIAAIASPRGGAARGIVRLSGPAVEHCVNACFRPQARDRDFSSENSLRTATEAGAHARACVIEGELRLPSLHSPIPCEVYLWPQGRSYTGQAAAEFHTFGSPPLLELLLKSLCAEGARLAQPGEFTMRAFLSGRIDLTQAEAVLGVIDAVDRRQLQTAIGQLAGGLAGPLHSLRDELLELLAHLEAGFDFAEEDISFITTDQIDRQLVSALERVSSLLEKMSSRNLVESSVKVVLIGRPNAGKSSLFNALIQKSGALVSPQSGTTRDYLAAELDLAGLKCQLIDTAGVEADLVFRQLSIDERIEGEKEKSKEGNIESSAQSATCEQHRQATFRVVCLDSTTMPNDWEQDQIETGDRASTLFVLTKIDQGRQIGNLSDVLPTSSATGEGIDVLRKELREKILLLGNAGGEVVAGTASRCRESLETAGGCLRRAKDLSDRQAGEEFLAGEIRLALEEIGRVAGAVYTDDVLDRIFSRFCVGK